MKRIAIDTMIFIYLLEQDDRYQTQVESLFHLIEQGKLEGITSIISVMEVLSATKLTEMTQQRDEIVRFFQETPNLTVVPVDWPVGNYEAQLRREHTNLRTPDSLLIATAFVHKASEFITNDSTLLHLPSPPLHICSLPQFLSNRL